MTYLTTATGRSIPCDSVIKASVLDYLTIHTGSLSRIEIDTVFDNPAETERLTAITVENETNVTQVYTGYTVLDTVQLSPFYPGHLMIWLRRPEEV